MYSLLLFIIKDSLSFLLFEILNNINFLTFSDLKKKISCFIIILSKSSPNFKFLIFNKLNIFGCLISYLERIIPLEKLLFLLVKNFKALIID